MQYGQRKYTGRDGADGVYTDEVLRKFLFTRQPVRGVFCECSEAKVTEKPVPNLRFLCYTVSVQGNSDSNREGEIPDEIYENARDRE